MCVCYSFRYYANIEINAVVYFLSTNVIISDFGRKDFFAW